jgi:hypothetical protein
MMSNEIKIEGVLIGTELLNPYAYRSYRSIIRKNDNIRGHLLIINEMLVKVMDSLPVIQQDDENRMICSLQDCCENIYACMDYLSQVLRQVCKQKYRGTELLDGFNSILKDVLKDEERSKDKKKAIYENRVLKNYILKAKYWYDIVHSIRTEETHYGMGHLKVEDDKIIYCNLNRNGESETIEFEMSLINEIYLQFCNYINELDKLVISFSS